MTSQQQQPTVIAITGAAGQIGYSIIFMIASGRLLGKQPIELRLLDLEPMQSVLEGVSMEIDDCAFSNVKKVVCTADYRTAFENADVVFLIGARPRTQGMDRKDLLQANAHIFEGQGKALNDYAKRTVKILVVGNPANTNALITAHYAPSLPKTAITAMTRLDHNRGLAQLSKKMNVNIESIHNFCIWGNHSNTQYPDITQAYVQNGSSKQSIKEAVNDEEWLQTTFIKNVQMRGSAIINQLKKSSAASAATAAIDHMHDWIHGTPEGSFVSMGVYSNGNPYGVPDDLMFSFPCRCVNGEWKIVEGLELSDFSKEKLRETTEELTQERKDALGK
jgi:malate dehydrogenase